MTLILTPLKMEQQYLIEGFEKRGLCFDKKTFQKSAFNSDHHFLVAQGGHGKTQFGIQTQYWLLKEQKIKKIIVVGAAGGLSPDVEILDLVVVQNIIEHDYKMFFSPKEKKPDFKTSPLLYEESKNYPYKIHKGALASGDEDIVTPQRAQELFEQTQCLAVAWESAGGIRAARFNDIPYFEVRGVTDNARNNVVSDFKKNLKTVMDQIADFLIPILPHS